VVGAELLGKVLMVGHGDGAVSGRITETEAYTSDDAASHSFNGRTARNAVMFGRPGHLYVYLSYGIHRCANVVTGTDGDGQAVLIRSVDPLSGLDEIRRRRAGRNDGELTNGPGKLCAGLGIDLADSGIDLADPASSVRIMDDGTPAPDEPIVGPRIGITKSVDTPWRFRAPPRQL